MGLYIHIHTHTHTHNVWPTPHAHTHTSIHAHYQDSPLRTTLGHSLFLTKKTKHDSDFNTFNLYRDRLSFLRKRSLLKMLQNFAPVTSTVTRSTNLLVDRSVDIAYHTHPFSLSYTHTHTLYPEINDDKYLLKQGPESVRKLFTSHGSLSHSHPV